ncbi:MAG: DNA primase small subunit PriS [Candidatus Caldarchaeum sp.]
MSFRTVTDAQLVQQLFRLYYERRYVDVFQPFSFERREFGYMPFGQRVMVRHLSFRNFDDLRKMLVREAPLHVYRSAALYQYPQAPMEEKGWLGAELIFDIDADHLETSCKQGHDYYLCLSCGRRTGEKTQRCGGCGGEVAEVKMVCDTCLGKTKQELLRLIDFMENDFGLSSFTVSFSGNRGYHLAVEAEEVLELGRDARQEIVDYVTGSHIGIGFHGLPASSASHAPDYSDPGWRGRIARGVRRIVLETSSGDDERLSRLLGPRQVEELRSISSLWRERPRWELLKQGKRSQQLEKLVALSVDDAASHVDTVVTTDVHRLLRLADTLNGKTGLRAMVVSRDLLEDFNPLRDAVALPEEPLLAVKVFHTPSFMLGDNVYGPWENQAQKLPAYAAVYLLCKGLATLA